MKKLFIISMLFLTPINGTELRKKVAIIDTGISSQFPKAFLCSEGHYDVTGEGLEDSKTHGTIIANIIKDYVNPVKTCFVIVKYYSTIRVMNGIFLVRALRYVSDGDYIAVNMSSGGDDFSNSEYYYISNILKKGTAFFVPSGNDGRNLAQRCNYYPACDKFSKNSLFFVVGACDKYRNVVRYSGFGTPPVNAYEEGGPYCWDEKCSSGTSYSTANHCGKWLKENGY